MRKILIFTGLKLAEIMGVCGIVGILYGMGWFITNVIGYDPKGSNIAWLIFKGFYLGLIPLFLIFAIGIGIYHVIKANWTWADRISRKKK